MCELFGISSSECISCNELLRTFYKNAMHHPDGWGLAIFSGNWTAIEKEPISAAQSIYLQNRLTEDIYQPVLMAHIRKASVGSLSYSNTHPFTMLDATGRRWTLAHNGTVFESEILDRYKELQHGQCDSERILLYLIDQINAAIAAKKETDRPCLSDKERFDIVDEVIHDICPKNKINLLIYDSDLFYIHSNHPDSLHWCRKDSTVVISTQPLACPDTQDCEWRKVPLNTLMAYRQGNLVFTGRPHVHLFLKEHETADGFDPFSSTNIFYI